MRFSFSLEVVIYKISHPCGLRAISSISALSFGIFSWLSACIHSSPPRIGYMYSPLCRGFSSYLLNHLRTAYIYIHLPFPNPPCMYTGESSFPLSHLLSTHTPILCLPTHPPSLAAVPHPFRLLSLSVCFASAQ